MEHKVTEYGVFPVDGVEGLLEVVKGRLRALRCIFSTSGTAVQDLATYISEVEKVGSGEQDAKHDSLWSPGIQIRLICSAS
jgi:hypothetical protein